MSKTISNATITTKAARSRLLAGLHWRSLDRDVHLGFRKGVRTGRWLVRWRVGSGYQQAALATADDVLSCDGKTTLDFEQACRRARDYVENARLEAAAEAAGPAPTVRSAAGAYATAVEARQIAAGRRISRDCRSRFKKHLFDDELAEVRLFDLKAENIRNWRTRLRLKVLAAASIKRACNDLRAALNEAALFALAVEGHATAAVR